MGFLPGKCLRTTGYLFASLCLSSCALIGSAYQEKLERQFSLPSSSAKFFESCVNSVGGYCPIVGADVPATPDRPIDTSIELESEDGLDDADTSVKSILANQLAAQVLNSDIQTSLNGLMQARAISSGTGLDDADISSILSGTNDSEIFIDGKKFVEYQNLIEQVTIMDGWESLESELDDADADNAHVAKFISKYMRDYFRNGKLIKLEIDGSALKKEWSKKIATTLPGIADESHYDDLSTNILKNLGLDENSKYAWGKISADGFVSRTGVASQFPAVAFSYDPAAGRAKETDVDFSVVGSDLVRVLLHAVSDAHNRLPAITGSSATTAQLQDVGLPLFDPSLHGVTAQQFDRVDTRAAQVEGVVGSGVGRLIRGASVLSLNNEPLAKLVETSIAVAARKKSEKIFWCYYACKNALEQSLDDADVVFQLDTTTELKVIYDD